MADTSTDVDRRVKVPLYARSGVPETWLLDLEQETLTAYRDPAADGYRAVQVLRRGEQLAPAACPERALAVGNLLG